MEVVTAILLLLILPIAVVLATWRWGPWGKDIKFVVSFVALFAWFLFFFTPIGLLFFPD